MEAVEIREKFGATVRKYRLSVGISQEELADRADLHRTYISSTERGERNVSLVNIHRLANALAIKPKELFSDED